MAQYTIKITGEGTNRDIIRDLKQYIKDLKGNEAKLVEWESPNLYLERYKL